jgi:hypothetical protein
MRHHPHKASIDLASDTLDGDVVRTPDGGTQAPLGVVETLEKAGLILPLEQGHDWAACF